VSTKIFFLTLLATSLGFAAKPIKKFYPQILEIEGQVQDFSQTPTRNLKLKDRVLESFFARISDDGRILMDLYDGVTLEGYASSEFEMPNISWETRQISELQLLNGRILLEKTKTESPPLKVKSPLFEFVMPMGEVALFYDAKKAFAEVLLVQGELVFGALNADETVTLKKGQKVSFQGVREDGEISYDLLLKGRKVPKGKLNPVQSMTAEDFQNYSFQQRRAKLDLQKKKRLKQKEQSLLTSAKNLCSNPKAQLNQCVWKQEKGSCIRRRCTAGGLWKDPQVVGDLECQTKKAAQECDY
jgi:hypothetical protein